MADHPHTAPFQAPSQFAIDYLRTLTQESEEAPKILDSFEIYDEHTKSAAEIADELATNLGGGLYNEEAQRRLQICGHNELKGSDGVLWWRILLAQVTNALTVILLVAAVLAGYKKDWIEFGVIFFVIITNTTIGFSQEYRAEKTMDALRRMASPTARVMRETIVEHIAARDVVPGDIILVEEGDTIPADARIYECFNLEVSEALLTGESVPVIKNSRALKNKDEPIGDRLNMLFSSTTITRGRANAVVTKTGNHTQMGKIASELMKASATQVAGSQTGFGGQQKTPLQTAMNHLAYGCFALVVVLMLSVFAVNNFNITDSILGYAISVGIAIIPEGLLTVITITMAIGVKNMAQQKAIVRKMLALENIGSTTVICSDKTGTLTQGKMVLKQVYVPGCGSFAVSGNGYSPIGEIKRLQSNSDHVSGNDASDKDSVAEHLNALNMPQPLFRLTECASLCNMAIIKRKGLTAEEQAQRLIYPKGERKDKKRKWKRYRLRRSGTETSPGNTAGDQQPDEEVWEAIGDPTEAALQAFAWKAKLSKPSLVSISVKAAPLSFELLQEYPFDAVLKRMSVIYREQTTDGKKIYWTFAKGSVESLLDLSKGSMSAEGEFKPFESEEESKSFARSIIQQMETFAGKGLRVLALACKRSLEEPQASVGRDEAESELMFLGIVGIYDPPRPESKQAIQQCHEAGIAVHMLTGDHPKTAAVIAKEIGILPSNYQPSIDAVSATDFDKLSDETLATMRLPRVIARCSPTTKVKMVNALQARKQVVVMTGDGTNDAPSLKKANIGIAMGMAGSDVAKQASDIILTDDNFATIVKAVAEGRRIFRNVQKFVSHLMTTNVSEIIVLIIGLAFKDQRGQSVFPMSAIQILVLNMLTSSPPAIGLGLEPQSPELMKIPPRDTSKPGSGVFSYELVIDIFYYGTVMGVLTLSVWSVALYADFQPNPSIGLVSPLGLECSENTSGNSDLCHYVFRARGAAYAALSLMFLIHAYNLRSLKYSIIKSSKYGPRTFANNKVLMWSTFSGIVIIIVTLYIPVLNRSAFLHEGISWEWIPVVFSLVVFMALVEGYKYCKRHYFPKSFFAAEFNQAAEYGLELDEIKTSQLT